MRKCFKPPFRPRNLWNQPFQLRPMRCPQFTFQTGIFRRVVVWDRFSFCFLSSGSFFAKLSLAFTIFVLAVSCSHSNKVSEVVTDSAPTVDPTGAITVETSGDLYEDRGSDGYSMIFNGRCEQNGGKVIIKGNSATTEVSCAGHHYTYQHLIPRGGPVSENTFWLTQLSFYHPGKEASKAQSWILFDITNRTVRTVLNQQYRFENRINGSLKPILELTALGACSGQNSVKMSVGGVNEFQQPFNQFQDEKVCQNGRFYFLTQTERKSLADLKFEIAEIQQPTGNANSQEEAERDIRSTPQINNRSPASEEPNTEKEVFRWSVDLYQN